MIGTEKQIAWAEQIKAATIRAITIQLKDVKEWAAAELHGETDQSRIDTINARVACFESRLAAAAAWDDAKAIIDGRNKPWNDGFNQHGYRA